VYSGAREAYAPELKAVPMDIMLWVLASRLEEADGKSIRALALIEKARLVNPKSDVRSAEAVGIEERSGVRAGKGAARARYRSVRSSACWSMAIWTGAQRKAHNVDR
jgi:pre-mRNA-processing factor 6